MGEPFKPTAIIACVPNQLLREGHGGSMPPIAVRIGETWHSAAERPEAARAARLLGVTRAVGIMLAWPGDGPGPDICPLGCMRLGGLRMEAFWRATVAMLAGDLDKHEEEVLWHAVLPGFRTLREGRILLLNDSFEVHRELVVPPEVWGA